MEMLKILSPKGNFNMNVLLYMNSLYFPEYIFYLKP